MVKVRVKVRVSVRVKVRVKVSPSPAPSKTPPQPPTLLLPVHILLHRKAPTSTSVESTSSTIYINV